MTLAEYFETGPAHERPVCEAVIAHLHSVGPIHVEPLSVGIFLKRAQTFAQLRPKTQWVALSFALRRRAEHQCITRKVQPYNGRYWHVANLRTPHDFDDQLQDLLTEAYWDSPA